MFFPRLVQLITFLPLNQLSHFHIQPHTTIHDQPRMSRTYHMTNTTKQPKIVVTELVFESEDGIFEPTQPHHRVK